MPETKVTIKVEIAMYAADANEAVDEFYLIVPESAILEGKLNLAEILPKVGGLLAEVSQSYDALNYGGFHLPDEH